MLYLIKAHIDFFLTQQIYTENLTYVKHQLGTKNTAGMVSKIDMTFTMSK